MATGTNKLREMDLNPEEKIPEFRLYEQLISSGQFYTGILY
jgi:hypothetical protein